MSSFNDFRSKMKKVLNSHKFHTVVLILIVLDCFFVTAELVIDHINEFLRDAKADLLKNCPKNTTEHAVEHTTEHATEHSSDYEDEQLESGFGRWGPYLHVLEETFKYMSLAILCLFIIEIIIKLIFTPKSFLKILEIFDVFVILVSFSLNIYLFNKKHHIHSITGLITMLRLWRFTEIINGI